MSSKALKKQVLKGLRDPDVLWAAAESGRILVTHDRRSMPHHFCRFIATRSSPGLIVVAKDLSIGMAVDELFLIWTASEAEEWRNRLVWIPF